MKPTVLIQKFKFIFFKATLEKIKQVPGDITFKQLYYGFQRLTARKVNFQETS